MLLGMNSYPQDNFDGVLRPRLVVEADRQLVGTHQGGVHVQPGATLFLNGTIQGSLAVEDGAAVELAGTLQGSLHIDQGGSALVTGAVQGSTTNFGSVVVEQTGTAAGSVHNEGLFVLRGRQGGGITGAGELRVEPGGQIVPSTRQEEGRDVYEWTY
jgi:cytoskeletal protein CcmA (bactofilin family)